MAAALSIPETPADLTAEWLTASLTDAGVLRRGRVTGARWERVGQQYGFTGVVGRLHLRYEDEGGDAPATLIAKLPMAAGDAVSAYRKLQERDLDRYYERCAREARFYRDVPVAFAPRLYYSAADDARRLVILLLEDVGGGRQGDVLAGCSLDDAALVIEELAPFHARWWERVSTTEFPPAGTDDPQTRQKRYAGRISAFLSEYGDTLPPGVSSIVERLGSRLAAVAAALSARPRTLIHGDLHLDNLIFDARGDRRCVVVVDWQTVSVGPPAWDVVTFLVGSLAVEDRRGAESRLWDHYVTLLAAQGVRGYSVDDLRHDCRFALLVLLAGTVMWLTGLDRDDLTARERALQQAAIADGRLTAALLDHDVGALLT